MQGGALDARILVCIWPLWPPMGAQTEPQEHGRPGSGSWWHITDPDPDLWSLSWGSSELALGPRTPREYVCVFDVFPCRRFKEFQRIFAWTLRLFMQASLPLHSYRPLIWHYRCWEKETRTLLAAFATSLCCFPAQPLRQERGETSKRDGERKSKLWNSVSTFMTFEDACLSFVVIFLLRSQKINGGPKGCSGANAKLWWAKCLPFATSHTQKQYSEIWSCDSAVWNHCLVLFHQRHVFLVCYFTNNHQHSKLLLFQEFKHLEMLIGRLTDSFHVCTKALSNIRADQRPWRNWPIRENLDVRGVGVDPPVLTFPNSYILQRDEQFGEAFKYCSACHLRRLRVILVVPARRGMTVAHHANLALV